MPPSEEDDSCPAEYEELVSLLKCPLGHIELMMEATQILEQISLKKGFTKKLLQILIDHHGQDIARFRAASYLKHQIRYLWTAEKRTNLPQAVMSDNDKQLVRLTIINKYFFFPVRLADVETAITLMTYTDFLSRQWSYLPPTLFEAIDEVNDDGVANLYTQYARALTLFAKFLRSIDLRKSEVDRPEIERFMKSMLQRMLHLYRIDENKTTKEVFKGQKFIFKALYAVFRTSTNKEVITEKELNEWIGILLCAIDRAMPQVAQIESDGENRPPFWSCKKWAIRCISVLFTKYVTVDHVLFSNNRIAKFFADHVAVPAVASLKTILQMQLKGQCIDGRVLYYSFKVLADICPLTIAWNAVKVHVDEIYRPAILKCLTPTQNSLLLFEAAPIEYIQREYDLYRYLFDESVAAADLLKAICRQGQLKQSFDFAVKSISDAKSERDVEAALTMLGYIGDVVVEMSPLLEVERVLKAHVIPVSGSSSKPRMRAKACWTLGRYAHARLDQSVIDEVQSLLVERIFHDSSVPVMVEAIIAHDALVDDDILRAEMRKYHNTLAPLMTNILVVTKDTFMEEPVLALKKLLSTFPIKHFGETHLVIRELTVLYKDLIKSMNEGGADVWATVSAVVSCVNVIADRTQDFGVMYHGIVEDCIKIAFDIFVNRYAQLYEDASILVATTVYVDVLECHWKALFYAYRAALLFDGPIFPTLMPMLHKLAVADKTWLLDGPRRLHVIYQLIVRTLRDPRQPPQAHMHAAKLLECIVLGYSGRLNHCVEYFTEECLKLQKESYFDSKSRIMNAVLLIACLTENRQLMLNKFSEWGELIRDGLRYLANFLICNASSFQGIHDRRMYVAGWVFLWRCPASYRPKIIVDQTPKVIECIMNVFEGLGKARKTPFSTALRHIRYRSSESDGFGSLDNEFQEEHEYSDYAEYRDHNSQAKGRERTQEELLEFRYPSLIDYETKFDEYNLLNGAFTCLLVEDRDLLQKLSDTASVPEHQKMIYDEVKKVCSQRYIDPTLASGDAAMEKAPKSEDFFEKLAANSGTGRSTN